MSTIPVTDHGSTAANGTALASAISTALSGDTITLAASSFAYDLGAYSWPAKTLTIECLTSGTPVADPIGDGSTWGPFAHYAATVALLSYYSAGTDLTFINLGITKPAIWPDKASHQSWPELLTATYALGTSGDLFHGNGEGILRLTNCEVWVGYGTAGVAFGIDGKDPATGLKYDELKTTTHWWATLDSSGRTTSVDTGGRTFDGYGDTLVNGPLNYNSISNMPAFAGAYSHGITLNNVWIHDVGQGPVPGYVGDGSGPGFIFDQIVVERSYSDLTQIAVDVTATGMPAYKVTRAIYRDQLGSGRDDSQIHGDFDQTDCSIDTFTITGGSGYTDGTYVDVLMTGGGVTAKSLITVSGGAVTSCQLVTNGVDDATGGAVPENTDMTLNTPGIIGGGSGFKLHKGFISRALAWEADNILFYQSPTARSQPQGPFWQGGADHNRNQLTVYDAPKFRNILILIANKGLCVAPARDAYVRNYVAVNPGAPWAIDDGVANPTYFVVTDKGFNSWPGQTKHLQNGVIYEGDSNDANNPIVTWKKVSAFNSVASQAATFVAPTATPAQASSHVSASASEVYANFRTKGAFAAAGPQYSTLRAMLTATMSFTGEPPHLSFLDASGLETNTLTTSALSYIHGGNVGDTLPITLPAGLAAQVLDTDRSTVLQAWTTSLTTVTVGKYLQVRATSSASFSTPLTFNIVLGGVTFPWTVTTRSNLAFPRVTKPNTNMIRRTSAGAFAAAGSKKGMAFFEIMIASGQTLNINSDIILTGSSGRNFSMTVGSAGATWSANMGFTNSSGSTVALAAYTGLACDVWYRISLIADTAQITKELAVLSQAQSLTDSSITTPTVSYTQDALIAWDFAHSANGVQLLPSVAGGIGLLALVAGEALATFPNFTPDFAGYQGQGLSATSRQIEVFLPGEVSPSNRGITSIAGGGVWGVNTGSLTASGAGTWAPSLQLIALPQTAGPYITGSPIDILVQAIGRPQPLNLTAASDHAGTFSANPKAMAEGSNGVTFTYTPTVAGSHSITFTNDATPTYGNPSATVLSVAQASVPGNGFLMRMRAR